MLTAWKVSKMARLNYNTLLYWLRMGIITATIHPGKQWGKTLFTEREAATIARKASRVRELRAQLAEELSPPTWVRRRRAA